MITITSDGSFDKTERYLRTLSRLNVMTILERYGQRGVTVLSEATPRRTGTTANSWSYEVDYRAGTYSIYWKNNHIDADGVPIAILLQYGHATGTGGYVQGIDYINPAIRPLFDQIAEDVWKVVKSA